MNTHQYSAETTAIRFFSRIFNYKLLLVFSPILLWWLASALSGFRGVV
jgi:hypothetical protein